METIRQEGDFKIIKIDNNQYQFEHNIGGETFS